MFDQKLQKQVLLEVEKLPDQLDQTWKDVHLY